MVQVTLNVLREGMDVCTAVKCCADSAGLSAAAWSNNAGYRPNQQLGVLTHQLPHQSPTFHNYL